MAAEVHVYAHEAADIQVRTVGGRLMSVDIEDGRGDGHLHMTTRAADSLYLKLGAALHGADEPAREARYQEQQVRDAVERGLGMEHVLTAAEAMHDSLPTTPTGQVLGIQNVPGVRP